jgi:hypothetical protein
MKKLFVLFISVSLNATLFTGFVYSQSNEPFATYTFGSFVASSIKDIEVNTSGGSITVNGSTNSEAVVEVYVTRALANVSEIFGSFFFRRNRSSNENIKKMLEDNYTIDIKVENEKLYAVATLKIMTKD